MIREEKLEEVEQLEQTARGLRNKSTEDIEEE